MPKRGAALFWFHFQQSPTVYSACSHHYQRHGGTTTNRPRGSLASLKRDTAEETTPKRPQTPSSLLFNLLNILQFTEKKNLLFNFPELLANQNTSDLHVSIHTCGKGSIRKGSSASCFKHPEDRKVSGDFSFPLCSGRELGFSIALGITTCSFKSLLRICSSKDAKGVWKRWSHWKTTARPLNSLL